MIKIMHICSDSIVGGATVTLLRLIKTADKQAFRHIVILPRENRMYSEFEKYDVDIIPLKAPPDRSFSIRGLLECLKHINVLRPDIIHTHGAVFGRLAGYIGGVRSLIYTRHTFKNKKTSALLKCLNNTISTIAVAASNAVIDQMIESGIAKEKIQLIENGCEDMSISTDKNCIHEKCRMLCLGRLNEEKGIILALEAMRILITESDRYHLTIVGDGEMQDKAASYIENNNLSEFVTMMPFQCDVRPILSKSDILLSCSYENEATSLSVIEALSASLPICASDIAGNSYIVSQGQDGVLYKSGDARALAMAVVTVCDHYDDYSIGARQKYLDRFTVARMTDKYEKIWREEYERIKS